ncbi:hypothetical protein SAMN05519103_00367 [Rhizobiales bacterium GAS113]|nr:hypothetical protein SAMN05519103_00367 [Rhizobiales bacterium GAS113]
MIRAAALLGCCLALAGCASMPAHPLDPAAAAKALSRADADVAAISKYCPEIEIALNIAVDFIPSGAVSRIADRATTAFARYCEQKPQNVAGAAPALIKALTGLSSK